MSLQCDLVDNREVSNVEGRDLAKSFGVPFFESSAKSRINVEEAFYELVRVFSLFAVCTFASPALCRASLTPCHSGPRNSPSNCDKSPWPCFCSQT